MNQEVLNKYAREMYHIINSIYCCGQHFYSDVDQKDVESFMERIQEEL